jgi:hypothetical protein
MSKPMDACCVCGSVDRVNRHHIFPKCWKEIPEGYEEQKIPLCHECHHYMPPFVLQAGRTWQHALKICRKLNSIYPDLHFHLHHGKLRFGKTGKAYWNYWVDVHPFKYKNDPLLVHEKESLKVSR